MNSNILTNIILLVVLILAQVLICNHIMLFNVAMAFVFIYTIVSMPMSLNINWLLTIGFFSGLIVDLFSDTPGVNSLACTLLAMMKRPALYAYIPKDDHTKNVTPSLYNLGFGVYTKYLLTLSAIYCVIVFSVEYFNYAAVKDIVIMSGASALFTFLSLLAIDSLIVSRREKRL